MPKSDKRIDPDGSFVVSFLNDPPLYQAREIDLSQFAAASDLFGSGLSPAEEQRRKAALAARHKCSPEDIRLGRTPYGGTYSISRGSGGHYSHEEYDDNHKLVWFQSISASPHG